ncbi:N-acetylmuramoyl-L-alanine amidase [Clostridium tetani]|uniref:N-acetylmuramoyl-L-alanine amidase n=1 Tax=Clostridium tetani TaxID=1513 RepID=UPI00100B04CA|nr:N-acetylmuramoyl-L-alanine amidase [Clostridium tetani]RXI55556.1 N-acetylmuramoyl-L-alanine amidase [Clostridium tetani]RXM72002.1 N-acetylmuramoyl-L-alanine amidase [Clostridium tetani]
MKIGIDCGHTLNGADYGSKGVLRDESYLTREMGVRVVNKLKSLGHTVINCYKDNCSSLGDSLSYRVTQANNNNVDLFISIHFNAFNGSAYGTEVFTYGGRELPQARAVLNNIEQLGYKNRCKDFKGNNLPLKDGSNLYVLKNTKMKSMLIECCFCDNKTDMGKYDPEKFANAIVEGIIGKNVSNTSKPSSYIKIDGGGYASYQGGAPGMNLIIRDYSKDINRIFAWVDNDKGASWAFDLTPPNQNYTKLFKNTSKVITKRNGGCTFSRNSMYKLKVKGYNKCGQVIAENQIVLKVPKI